MDRATNNPGDGHYGDAYTDASHEASVPEAPKPTNQGIWAAILGALLALMVAGGMLGFVLLRIVNNPTKDANSIRRGDKPGDIRLEPVTFADQDSFTKSLVNASDDDLGAFASKAKFDLTNGTTVEGITSGLYGSRGDSKPCDIDKLVTLLNSNGSVTKVWSNLMRVEISQVEEAVRSLTPVVLQADTAVTNHSYKRGSARSFQSVLQAGTPVLIDAFGMPRVKCSCGNPLLPPLGENVEQVNGEKWDSFEVASVITIKAPERKTDSIETVDVDTGEPVVTPLDGTDPTGGNVSLDGVLVATSSGVSVVDTKGTRTQVLDRPVSKMFDDGRGGLVFTLQRTDSVDRWDSLPPEDPDQAVIWYLPAGDTEAAPLVELPTPEGWFTLETVGALGGNSYALYKSLTTDHDPESGDPISAGSLNGINLESRQSRVLVKDAEGPGISTRSVSIANDQLVVWSSSYESNAVSVYDAQFATDDKPACFEYTGEPEEDVRSLCPTSGILDGTSKIVSLDSSMQFGRPSTDTDKVIQFDLEFNGSRDLTSFVFPEWVHDWANQFRDNGTWSTAITQVSGQKAVIEISRRQLDNSYNTIVDEGAALIVSLTDGNVTDLAPDDPAEVSGIWVLSAPLLRPRLAIDNYAKETTSTTTSATAEPVRSMDLQKIVAGDFSSLLGTWRDVAFATNPHDGTGEQWRWVGSGPDSVESTTLSISRDVIFYNQMITVRGGTLTVDVGNGPESAQFSFEADGNHLSGGAEIGATSYSISIFPKNSVDLNAELEPNNGITLDNSKDVIFIWSSSNGSSRTFTRDK